jgi:AraC-like DNA-binding protein
LNIYSIVQIDTANFLHLPKPMDPLSDILALLKYRSVLSSRFEGRGSWAFSYPSYEAQIKFVCVLEGSIWIWMDKAPAAARLKLEKGDFFVLTNGKPFFVASDLRAPVLDSRTSYAALRCADGVVRQGSEGELVSLASGRFQFEGEAGKLLLQHLPPLIHLRASEASSRPLQRLLDLVRWEAGDAAMDGVGDRGEAGHAGDAGRAAGFAVSGALGADAVRASLATLVLVQALRIHLGRAPQPEGWLRAMTDPRIGAALTRMHGDLAGRWSVQSLAAVAGMSRTAFANRFKELTGTSPLDYLVNWRMTVARQALRDGEDGIARIAERMGYFSETAFSAAFKRATGQSPGRYRNAQRAVPA